mmetsp:Transcript_62180/g.98916  ORF Transcript_62180/g.98916 Transcript_62180/m.98916 type:complete len:338 (-) Transcript_62180:147-1160(-)
MAALGPQQESQIDSPDQQFRYFHLDEEEEIHDVDFEDIDLTQTADQDFTLQDYDRLMEVSKKSASTTSSVSEQQVKTECKRVMTKLMDRDQQTGATTGLTFGSFLFVVSQCGDSFIDKLVAPLTKLVNLASNVLHGLGHGICVGVGFLISFFLEWVLLKMQKDDHRFDEDEETNNRVYWDLVKRSFWSNIGGALAAVPAVAVSVAEAVVFGVLTGGIGCIVAIACIIAIGMMIKFGIKWWWNRHRRAFYNHLKVLGFMNTHKTFSSEELDDQFKSEMRRVENSERNPAKRRKRQRQLREAQKWLLIYLDTRHKENWFLAAKVEAYIKEKESSSCLVM